MLGDDPEMAGIFADLGIRIIQLTYNISNHLGSSCWEPEDGGLTRVGHRMLNAFNSSGILVDISHVGNRTGLEAIESSEKPIAITHANPSFWYNAKRNKSSDLLKSLSDSGGILGLSLYPHHLKEDTNCTLDSFCEMVAKTAEIMNVNKIGIGSDLCLNQPDEVVEWMRNGTWSKSKNYGEGSKNKSGFPKQPVWFEDARGFKNLENGLKKIGFNQGEVEGILGNNWYNFYKNI